VDEFDYWRLCESLTLAEASALIVGDVPTSVYSSATGIYLAVDYFDAQPSHRDKYFQAALSALRSAVKRGTLEVDEQPNFIDGQIKDTARVCVESLRGWLASRGITSGFFFPTREQGQPGYLERANPNYAPKLAAAIRAWEAVTSDPERLRGKTPKQALTKWLNEHAAAYGLTKEDGTPNATGVEEAAKLANWRPEGGASKTPGE